MTSIPFIESELNSAWCQAIFVNGADEINNESKIYVLSQVKVCPLSSTEIK